MKKGLTRLAAASLALALGFGAVACAGDDTPDATTTTAATTTEAAEETEETDAPTETEEETEAPSDDETDEPSTDGTDGTDEPEDTDAYTNNVDNSTIYPLEGDRSLTYWVDLNANVSATYQNLGDTPLYQAIMEETGVTVEFQHPGAGQADEQLSLLLTTGEYPDIIEYNWLGFAGGPAKALGDGVLIELNDVLTDYAPNLSAYLEARPDVDTMTRTDDGKQYVFPFIRGHEALQVSSDLTIRQDWLDELGLDMPVTMEDWENVLTAFRDEKGALAPLTMTQGHVAWAHFTNPYGIRNSFFVEDGEVKYGAAEPGYRDFLETFSRWYQEGLLDPDLATITGQQITAKMTTGEAGVSMGYTASSMGNWTQAARETNPDYLLAGAPIPVMEEGGPKNHSPVDFPYIGGGSAGITTSAEDVEAAARFLDFNYSNEGHIFMNFGIEGESYEWEGDYPTYKDEMSNDPEGRPFATMLGQYIRGNYSGPFVQDVRYIEQYLPFPEQGVAVAEWANTDALDYALPPVTATPEESSDLATIMNEVNAERDRMFLAFLFGDESLDNFDSYVESLNNMGLQDAIEIQEAAIERYNNR